MSEPVKRINPTPESYCPKDKPEILNMAEDGAAKFRPGQMNNINNVLRLFHDDPSHNYMFCECMWSLMRALNEDARLDFQFFAAVTGDLFSQIWLEPIWNYNDSLSSVFKDTLIPIQAAFGACGYDFDYIPQKEVQANKQAHIQRIMKSIDHGVPVLTFGIIGPPICSIITGYADEGAQLIGWAQFTDEPKESNPLDLEPSPGLFCVRNGLDRSVALVFPKEKNSQPNISDVYYKIISKIPNWIAVPPEIQKQYDAILAPKNVCLGKTAFDKWADTYADDAIFENDAILGSAADTYGSCMVMIGTNMHHMQEFLNRAQSFCPDAYDLFQKLRTAYSELNAGLQDLISFQGGYFIDSKKFMNSGFRVGIAERIRHLGVLYQAVGEVIK